MNYLQKDKQKLKITEKMQAEGKDRHELQHALMPFELPMNYKEKNERVGDK